MHKMQAANKLANPWTMTRLNHPLSNQVVLIVQHDSIKMLSAASYSVPVGELQQHAAGRNGCKFSVMDPY